MREQLEKSVTQTKEKVTKLETLVNVLEEILFFDESLKQQEMKFWRERVLKHRQVVRLYQDAILTQLLEKNEKLRTRMAGLLQMNEEKDSKRLAGIETKYHELLATQRKQQIAMKKCEQLLKQKDDEIYQLRSQLTTINLNSRRTSKSSLNGGGDDDERVGELLRLRGEIAQKKLFLTRQLNALRVNMNESVET